MHAYTKLSPHDLAEIVKDMVMWYVDDLEDIEEYVIANAYASGHMVSFMVARWLVETTGCKRVHSNLVFNELDLCYSKMLKTRTVESWESILTLLARKYREHNDSRDV